MSPKRTYDDDLVDILGTIDKIAFFVHSMSFDTFAGDDKKDEG